MSAHRWICLRLALVATLPAALAACSANEALSPVPTAAADAGLDAGDDAGSDAGVPPPPPVDAGTVKRTVMVRNPYGGPAGNYLADGDFERSTVSYTGGQMGWRGYAADSSQELIVPTETGGLCKSGLRCAVMKAGAIFILRGTSAAEDGIVASGWAKPADGAGCGTVRSVLIDCDSFAVIKSLAGKKADDGWCHYTATLPKQQSATCVYIDSTLKNDATALVDAFVLGPDNGTVHPQSAEIWTPDAELLGRLETLRKRVIGTTPFGNPRPAQRPVATP